MNKPLGLCHNDKSLSNKLLLNEKEYKEIMEALDTLNKYRNFFHSSVNKKHNKISNIIDEFLPKLHNEIIDDELVRIVVEKLRKQKYEK